MGNSEPPEVILILNDGFEIEGTRPVSFMLDDWLRRETLDWFDARKYRRVVHPHGHVSYFRIAT